MMIDEKKVFVTWEEVIVDFIAERESQKVVDLLSKKDSKKGGDHEKQAVLIQLETALRLDDSVDIEALNTILSKKNSGQNKVAPLLFVQNKYKELISLSYSEPVKNVLGIYNNRLDEIIKFHTPKNWLDYYSIRASGVSFSTHVAKITHSSIKGSSFFVSYDDANQKILTTDTISKPVIDDAIDNAALTPIASLLKLEIDGMMLGDTWFTGDSLPLTKFSENEVEIECWRAGFSEVFVSKNLSSHTLLKQVYFPVDDTGKKYHLLNNIKSSSLAHELFFELTKKVEKNNNYNDKAIIRYPNKSKLSLTASSKAHTNVSPLHSKRDGKIYLLSNQPPTWKNQFKPPVYKKSMFDENFFYQNIKEDIDYLRDFLLRFESIDLSIKKPERKKWIDRWLANIIDEFLFFVGSVQNLPSGWSVAEDIKLKPAHQHLLDPYRKDDAFQSARNTAGWQAVVCKDFAHWLNRRLIGKDKQFTPQPEHRRMWESLLEKTLRDHSEMLDIELKFQVEATV